MPRLDIIVGPPAGFFGINLTTFKPLSLWATMSGVVTMAEHKLIDEAFSGNVQLAGRIHDALRMRPNAAPQYQH